MAGVPPILIESDEEPSPILSLESHTFLPTKASSSLAVSTSTQKLLRKIDLRLLPYFWLVYIFTILERVNIGNARIIQMKDGRGQLERDLKMSPEDVSPSLWICDLIV
jgi:hypothetical protein